MALRKSAEDYLETVLMIKNEKGIVHSIDIANHLGFSKPSVSRAVTNLRHDGYLTMKDDGELELTEKGLSTAQHVYERHTILTELLLKLGVCKKTADEDACLVEHVISEETFDKLRSLYHGEITLEK